MRTTKAELFQLVRIINNSLPEGWEMKLEWAYGKPRLYSYQPSWPLGRCDEVSPRLPMGEMKQWLNAFIDGLEWGRRGK